MLEASKGSCINEANYKRDYANTCCVGRSHISGCYIIRDDRIRIILLPFRSLDHFIHSAHGFGSPS